MSEARYQFVRDKRKGDYGVQRSDGMIAYFGKARKNGIEAFHRFEAGTDEGKYHWEKPSASVVVEDPK